MKAFAAAQAPPGDPDDRGNIGFGLRFDIRKRKDHVIMRRRIAALLSAALVTTTMAVLATASSASASTTVCAGQGTASVTPGLSYPVTGAPTVATTGTATSVNIGNPEVNAGFSFQFTPGLGACVPDLAKALSATGTVTGYCGHSMGRGITNNGHSFAWTSSGSFLVLTGGLVGVVNAVPDALAGESCSPATDPNGAQSFLVTGAVLLTFPCTTKVKTQLLTGVLHVLRDLIVASIHVTVWVSGHANVKVCI